MIHRAPQKPKQILEFLEGKKKKASGLNKKKKKKRVMD
jgi:hypothetical protein